MEWLLTTTDKRERGSLRGEGDFLMCVCMCVCMSAFLSCAIFYNFTAQDLGSDPMGSSLCRDPIRRSRGVDDSTEK